jgi:hypothetical protein
VIDPDIVELLESPCSLIVGTVDGDGLPDATRGWGALVLDGGERIRLLLSANATTSLRNLENTHRIALTATDFLSLRSVQVKGVASAVELPTQADRARFHEFCEGCVATLHAIDDTPEALIWRFMPSGVVACIVTVADLFDQTPGPGAGARLGSFRASQ